MFYKYFVYALIFSMILHFPVYGYEISNIEEKYYPIFEQIEEKAITELNTLIDEAYIEYERKKENNELTLPILFSYIEKGKKLEEEIDVAFKNVLAQLERELDEKGLSHSIKEPFEKQYLKSKRKNKLSILKNITLEGQTISFER